MNLIIVEWISLEIEQRPHKLVLSRCAATRRFTMQTRLVCALVAVMLSCAMAQLPPFAVLPDVPRFVEDNAAHANLNEFIKLWKQTLQNDGQGDAPTVRINFEPKTIVAPNDFQMRNIVPQHVSNPLLDLNSSFADLRREFLLDHILLDPVQLDDPALNTEQGLRMMTFSGKDLIFRFDEKLGLVADGVAVTSAMSLQDATRMLTTDGVLFDAKLRVNNVAQGGRLSQRSFDLNSPTGPPLDFELETQVFGQPQPPAPLTEEQKAESATAQPSRHISPPGLPPGAVVHPPAAPPASALGSSLSREAAPEQASSGAAPSGSPKSAGKVRIFKKPAGPPSHR